MRLDSRLSEARAAARVETSAAFRLAALAQRPGVGRFVSLCSLNDRGVGRFVSLRSLNDRGVGRFVSLRSLNDREVLRSLNDRGCGAVQRTASTI